MCKPNGKIKPGNGHGLFFRAKSILQRYPLFPIANGSVCTDTFLLNINHARLHVGKCNNDSYRIVVSQLAGI